MRHYQIAFFDMDGTLLDTSPGILNSLRYTVRVLGLADIDEMRQRTFIGPPLRDSVRRVFGLSDVSVEQFVKIFRQEYQDHQIGNAVLYPDILEALHILREHGIEVAVATNKPQKQAEYLVRKFKMEALIDYILGCDEAGIAEKGTYIRQSMLRFGADGRGVLVGDTSSDAQGARKGGVDLIGVLYGFGFSSEQEALDAGAVYAARSPLEAAEYIRSACRTD